MKYFCLLLLLTLHPFSAFAADDAQQSGSAELANPFSDYVPFEDEYDIDEDERFMYFGRFFAVSLGTGLHVFNGNIGKLYNTALPVLNFKLIYFFDFRLAGTVGFSNASHAFNADTTGYTDVNIMSINGDIKYYFDTKNVGATIASTNPYGVLGVSNTFRTQNFQGIGSSQKDTAFALSGGAGMEFALKPRKTSLGIEGRLHKIYFKDSGNSDFADAGINDLTGDMYSLITSVIFFF